MNSDPLDPDSGRFLKDFVDRKAALKIMTEMALGVADEDESDEYQWMESVATIFGVTGIGKTYLLREFFGRMMESPELHPVKFTFTGSPGTNFFDVIVNTIAYLGQDGFEEVGEAIREAAQMVQIDEAVIATEVAAAVEKEGEGTPPGSGKGIQIDQGAEVDRNTFSGNFAGNNLIIVNLALQGDDEKVQDAILGLVSNAFFRSLARIGRERRTVLLFDGWDQITNTELRHWLTEEFLNRLLEGRLDGVIVILASEEDPGLQWSPGHLNEMEMHPLPAAAMVAYFVGWGIDLHEAEALVAKTNGSALAMRQLARKHSPKAKPIII
jgi:hypothetical protein